MLRVFGETPGGQKTCLHVHRLFPYLYVPYDDDLPRDADGATLFLGGVLLGRPFKLAKRGD